MTKRGLMLTSVGFVGFQRPDLIKKDMLHSPILLDSLEYLIKQSI